MGAILEPGNTMPDASCVPEPALRPFGEVPGAYAIFQVDVDAETGRATDARYVYASPEYGRITRRTTERLVGRSHLEIGEVDADEWLELCRRAVGGEQLNGLEYNPLARSWISYNLHPAAIDGYCVYAFMLVDAQQLARQTEDAEARTYRFISEMLSALTGEQSHEAAMEGMLDMMSQVVHTDRLIIFECGDSTTTVTFERCAEGMEPQLGTVFPLPRAALRQWFNKSLKDPVALVPDVAILEDFSKPLYDWCRESGVHSLMTTPFFNDGELVGFLGAYNYQIDETVDLNRLFAAVSSFIAARIDNRRLIESLAWASDHDALTGLLNRRGAQVAIDALLAEGPERPHALVLVDLDDFKKINDVYGHSAGDEALMAIAQAIGATFPENALLCRNGGDEFQVVLAGDDAKRVDELVANLSHADLGYEHEGERYRVTLSIGYVSYPDQADDIEELYTKADEALYAVKLAGKAGYARYAPEAISHHRTQLGFTARDIMDNVPYPMVVHTADGKGSILFASAQLANELGYDNMYELMKGTGGTMRGIVHGDDVERVCGDFAQLAQSGTGKLAGIDSADGRKSMSFRVVAKDGSVQTVNSSCVLVTIEDVGEAFYTLLFPADE
ncbi:MAG TPA: hypothetical protein DCP91_00865 [Eggerthellaceae bacterium]|nr:hypothetical protein [Eggerthellaceae bacterium]